MGGGRGRRDGQRSQRRALGLGAPCSRVRPGAFVLRLRSVFFAAFCLDAARAAISKQWQAGQAEDGVCLSSDVRHWAGRGTLCLPERRARGRRARGDPWRLICGWSRARTGDHRVGVEAWWRGGGGLEGCSV
jgi:hypothetical protein